MEQVWGAASGVRSNFARQLRTAVLNGEQLWGVALERNFNFGERLSEATLGSSFQEPLWRIPLGSRIAALGQPLCRGALGNSFGKQLRGTALGSNFGKLSGTTLRNNCFEEQQLSGASSFGQLCGTALRP